jgi:hypothetical protein
MEGLTVANVVKILYPKAAGGGAAPNVPVKFVAFGAIAKRDRVLVKVTENGAPAGDRPIVRLNPKPVTIGAATVYRWSAMITGLKVGSTYTLTVTTLNDPPRAPATVQFKAIAARAGGVLVPLDSLFPAAGTAGAPTPFCPFCFYAYGLLANLDNFIISGQMTQMTVAVGVATPAAPPQFAPFVYTDQDSTLWVAEFDTVEPVAQGTIFQFDATGDNAPTAVNPSYTIPFLISDPNGSC